MQTQRNSRMRYGPRASARDDSPAAAGAPPQGTLSVSSSAALATRRILAELFGPAAERNFAVRLWDGSEDRPSRGAARFVLVLTHPGALRRMLLPPTELRLGEAYLQGDYDVEGDVEAAAALAEVVSRHVRSPAQALRLASRLLALPAGEAGERGRRIYSGSGGRHSRARDRRSVRYHYDVGNDFYALWLDQRMVYSCGYFPTGTEDLDAAQAAKLELICRKLRLRPGERLLDIGCGWGGFVLYAAEHYGVRALGITLSEPQAALARERIAAAGLSEHCQIQVRDYRDLPAATQFDKVASIGMVEHVGRAALATYFQEVHRLLRPGGLFLNHGIVDLEQPGGRPRRLAARRLRRWTSFIERYVFPDGELMPVAAVLRPAEAAGFEVRDVESLREHYACTLRHWVRRLEAAHESASALAGESTYRIWRLYMAGSAHAFAAGRIGVVQTLLARRDAAGAVALPATRADVYGP